MPYNKTEASRFVLVDALQKINPNMWTAPNSKNFEALSPRNENQHKTKTRFHIDTVSHPSKHLTSTTHIASSQLVGRKQGSFSMNIVGTHTPIHRTLQASSGASVRAALEISQGAISHHIRCATVAPDTGRTTWHAACCSSLFTRPCSVTFARPASNRLLSVSAGILSHCSCVSYPSASGAAAVQQQSGRSATLLGYLVQFYGF